MADDSIPGGMWLENYGPNPVKVYSHTEIRKLREQTRVDHMGREYQLTPFIRHVGVPGTDKSPHTTDWSKGSMDAQTLANATALLTRIGAQGSNHSDGATAEFAPDYNEPSDTQPEVIRNIDAISIQHEVKYGRR